MDNTLVTSHDGSHTLYSEKYKAHYHSIYGALDESIHIFITAGLYYKVNRGYINIQVFEMGFGTGLNAHLSYLEAEKYKVRVNYTGIETDPVSLQLIDQINYFPNQNKFRSLHDCDWDLCHLMDSRFTFTKLKKDIMQHKFVQSYDIIYFDAFAPECQGFLWEKELHQKLYDALNPYGILVTYCAKGAFKRMLKSVGYTVQSLNGPGKKREMVRAVKSY